MSVEMLFIVASLIFALAVVVGANIWALQEPPRDGTQRSLSKAIDEMLDPRIAARPPDRRPLPDEEARP